VMARIMTTCMGARPALDFLNWREDFFDCMGMAVFNRRGA
jgi:hypothetical protein